ncbi:ubiquitin c-terminal hydrolase [Diplodia corticola]|uniref:ubiquitinyl hydrolase 1 n=1 Tax=Diplodia corticola TaxID=236234 RepID=A0A1J9RZ28_9PEZI|nr:ubiquitin c-terminal hydrolase [Diplodia corticola]OJD33607.1 ubiquitin c-terminal hydrolase [Diplodia corticola]
MSHGACGQGDGRRGESCNNAHRKAVASRPLAFTTASIKKRKLAQDLPPEASDNCSPSTPKPAPTSAFDPPPPSASPRSSPHPPSVGSRTSASPPRYIPPHLRDEVLEPVAESYGPSWDNTASGGSSPSEAYAGLSLESTNRPGAPAGDRRGSSAVPEGSRLQNPPSGASVRSPPPRSASPAKRSASEMAGENDSREQMEMENGTARDSSVDMLRDEQAQPKDQNSGASSDTASMSVNESNTVSTSATSDAAPSPPNPKEQPASSAAASGPSLDEQVVRIMTLHEALPQDGQKGYIVSMFWLSRVLSRVSDSKQFGPFDKSASEGEVGPINNEPLFDQDASAWEQDHVSESSGQLFVPMKPGLQIGEDYEVFPEEAWNLMVEWYGVKAGVPPIIRYAHDTAPPGSGVQNVQYEIYPPFISIRKLRNDSEAMTAQRIKENSSNAVRLLSSRSERFQNFLRRAKEAAGIPVTTKVQIWRVLEPIQTGPASQQEPKAEVLTPATSRNSSPARMPPTPLLIDLASFTAMSEGTQREMVDHKDETNNPKYNGSVKMDLVGLNTSQVLILEEQIGGPAGGEFVSDNARRAASKHGVSLSTSKIPDSRGDSGRSSPAPGGPMTRGRTKNGRTRGTVGLSNLGNTCYMNSALQCIRSVEELTAYFMQNKYKEELNGDNPLGHGGAIAKSYAGLLASIYDESSPTSFAPKNFKYSLGRAQPMFSGYGQQDSQEFLSFLVDGLHEDLNRIIKKPYIENPDSDDNTHKDPEAIKALGEKYRENHRARNDSVAMDLFNGFYKNTMVCPECDKVSITFDPYSSLTLQMPIEKNWQHSIYFVPLVGRPVQIDVDIEPNRPLSAIKEFIGQRIPGVDPKRIMMSEIYSHKFYKHFEDRQAIVESSIQERDEIVAYELDDVPTNWPPSKKSGKTRPSYPFNQSEDDEIPDTDSPLADKMVVPVFHRVRKVPSNKWDVTLWPTHILVTRDQAKDSDEILRKVIGRVAGMTTREILNVDGAASPRDESDTVVTADEDASSNADARVQANSVEGDESIVDVTMTEPGEVEKAKSDENTDDDVAMQEQSSLPPVLQPGSFIAPELRRLFTLKYAKLGNDILPTGWSGLDAREYATLDSRIPTPTSRRSSIQSTASGSTQATQRSGTPESDVDEDTPQFSNTMESFEAEPSEDELAPVSMNKQANRQKFQNKQARRVKGKKGRKMKTYSRKDRRAGANVRAGSEPVSEPDGEPMLLRPGEVIIVDWESESFDALFGGKISDKNEMRGMGTWDLTETLPDADLAEKKKKRAARKKSGITLEDCFAETAKTEILSEENAWYCNRCKELRRASKTLEIWTAPDILVVHLKRFGANRGFRDKVDILVDFPIEGLDISERVGLHEGKPLVYDLFAVDNHFGGLGGGHYTAVAKNFYDGQWYDYNDSMVSKKSASNLVSGAAYLLFYRRRRTADDAPLGPPYLQEVVRQAFAPASESGDDSPSGNGQRLGGSSPNGSPRDSSAAGAGPRRAAGLAGVTTTTTALTNDDDDDDDDTDALPPPYEDNDEGISMDVVHKPAAGGGLTAATQPSWDWPKNSRQQQQQMDGGADDGDDDDDGDNTDVASDVAAMPESAGSDIGDRLMDFEGEDGLLSGPGNVTPVDSDHEGGGRGGAECPPALLNVGADLEAEAEMPDLEDDVAEVRVDEKDVKVD